VPAFIADLCYDASWRYVEFFTGNIRNTHTRRAYARAGARFFTWREQRESLQQKHSAPGVKQQLAAVRMLFDWLITGQVLPTNPAAAVRGLKHVVKPVKLGKTPVFEAPNGASSSTQFRPLRDLRDRALIATLTYSRALPRR
jgi:site-specific recombinase XerC